MKKLFNGILIIACALVMFSLCACSGADSIKCGGATSDFYAPMPDSTDGITDGDGSGGNIDYTQQPIQKQITAAEWNDLYNYAFWKSLFLGSDGQHGERIFNKFATAHRGLNTNGMHAVKVLSGDVAVSGAKVTLYGGSRVLYTAVTDGSGEAWLFGDGATGVTVQSGEFTARAQVGDGVTSVQLPGFAPQTNNIDIMLTVDTTGSMGDELNYLKKELSGVIQRIVGTSAADVNLGMVFYRDYDTQHEREEYLVKCYDFAEVNTTVGLGAALKNINAQYAAGGGDTPEAVDEALKAAVKSSWRDNSTKIMFFVLDAPYHDEQDNSSRFAEYVRVCAEKGIRIIPVAASGLDVLGQYIMRSAAMLTGGTYTFITNDSGIGDYHEEPAVGGYTVEYLSDLMVRLTAKYHRGA